MIRSIVRVALASLLVAFALVGPAEAAPDRVPLFRVEPGAVPLRQLPSPDQLGLPAPPEPAPFSPCFALGVGGPPCSAQPHSCLVRDDRRPGACDAPWQTLLPGLAPRATRSPRPPLG